MKYPAFIVAILLAITGCASLRTQGYSEAEGQMRLCRVMQATNQIAPGYCNHIRP